MGSILLPEFISTIKNQKFFFEDKKFFPKNFAKAFSKVNFKQIKQKKIISPNFNFGLLTFFMNFRKKCFFLIFL